MLAGLFTVFLAASAAVANLDVRQAPNATAATPNAPAAAAPATSAASPGPAVNFTNPACIDKCATPEVVIKACSVSGSDPSNTAAGDTCKGLCTRETWQQTMDCFTCQDQAAMLTDDQYQGLVNKTKGLNTFCAVIGIPIPADVPMFSHHSSVPSAAASTSAATTGASPASSSKPAGASRVLVPGGFLAAVVVGALAVL